MSTKKLQGGNTVQYSNSTGGTLVSGTVVEVGDLHGIVIADIADGTEGTLGITKGILLPATGTIGASGVPLYWDTTNLRCTPTKGAWKRIGTSGGAKDEVVTDKVYVLINRITEPSDDPTHLDIKGDVRMATDSALAAVTAAGSGIGKTLTADANGTLTVDSVATALGDRLLIQDQASGLNNGIYTVTTLGAAGTKFALTRATDADTDDRVTAGMICFASEGTVNADLGFILSTNDPITLDTTALTFTQFNALGMVTAGTGLTKSGNTINAIGGDGITANADDLALDLKTNGGLSIDTAELKLDLNDLSAATVAVGADSIGIIDAGSSNVSAKESIADLASAMAGNGLTATAGVFSTDSDTETGGNIQGVNVTANGVGVDINAITGTGIEADGAANLRLATQGAGIAGGNGTTLSLDLSYNADWTGAHTFNTTVPASSQTPSSASDLTNKGYVDGVASGLDLKDSVRLATAAALSAVTAAGSGVGKTLTADAVGVETVDGVTLTLNMRVLVKDQTSGLNNGIYLCTLEGSGAAAFVLTRATDADSDAEVNAGMFCFVEEGATLADNGFVLVTNDPITLDTTSLAFTQFSGAGMIIAGAGLTKSGNTLDVGAGNGITVNANDITIDPDNTTGATVAALSVTGNGAGVEVDNDTIEHASGVLEVIGVPALFEVDGSAVSANVTQTNLDELTNSGETNIHKHDDRYFAESEFINSSAGGGDGGKPIKLDVGGKIDGSMIDSSDVTHNSTTAKDGGGGGEFYHLTLAQHTLSADHKGEVACPSSGTEITDWSGALTVSGHWAFGLGSGGTAYIATMVAGGGIHYVAMSAAT